MIFVGDHQPIDECDNARVFKDTDLQRFRLCVCRDC